MRSMILRLPLLTSLMVIAVGCISPMTTRLPTFGVQHPEIEKRAYERHDPLPDGNLGPDTQARPRGFIVPRTEPRKSAESRLRQGFPPYGLQPGFGGPPTSSQYPQSVQP